MGFQFAPWLWVPASATCRGFWGQPHYCFEGLSASAGVVVLFLSPCRLLLACPTGAHKSSANQQYKKITGPFLTQKRRILSFLYTTISFRGEHWQCLWHFKSLPTFISISHRSTQIQPPPIVWKNSRTPSPYKREESCYPYILQYHSYESFPSWNTKRIFLRVPHKTKFPSNIQPRGCQGTGDVPWRFSYIPI